MSGAARTEALDHAGIVEDEEKFSVLLSESQVRPYDPIMDTTTLLAVVGGVVVVKTGVIAVLVARRDRGRRRTTDTVVAAARRVDPGGWRLQWAEPGVLLVSNTSRGDAAREVELTATLTASSGASDSVAEQVRFVGTGACFELRFAGLEPFLGRLASGRGRPLPGHERDQLRARLASTLTYSIHWRTPEGERRQEVRNGQPVLPVPDGVLEPA